MNNCGLAQVFDFTISGEKIWFTEWVENNIGVLDTIVTLPLTIELDSDTISLVPGESKNLSLIISASQNLDVSLVISTTSDSLDVYSDSPKTFQLESESIDVTISASGESIPEIYKVLLGVQTKDVSVSKFATIVIQ